MPAAWRGGCASQLGDDVPMVLGLWNANREQMDGKSVAAELGVTRAAVSLEEMLKVVRETVALPPADVAGVASVGETAAVDPIVPAPAPG